MAVYRRVYDSRHLQADCQESASAPEPYAATLGNGLPFLHLNAVLSVQCISNLEKCTVNPVFFFLIIVTIITKNESGVFV